MCSTKLKNTVVWSPYTMQNIETIERVQRQFTKNLPEFRKLTYKDRLRRLHLPSLELRRFQVDLVWCYKILFGIVDTPTEDFFVPSTYAPTRVINTNYLRSPMFHVQWLTFSVNVCVVNSWNSLQDRWSILTSAKMLKK